MAKTSENLHGGMELQSYQDLNSVTKLPALREVIKWFEEFSHNNDSESYLSVSVYEISKYLYIFENYGINAIDGIIVRVAELLQEIWGENSYIGHISDDRFVVISRYPIKDTPDYIMETLATDNETLQKKILSFNNSSQAPYSMELDYGYIVLDKHWIGGFEESLRLANSEMLLKRLQRDINQAKNTHTVSWTKQEIFNLLIEKNLFHYHFQPIVDTQSGNVFGYEALMRTAPEINMRPIEVIDIATNLGRLYDIEKATMGNVMEYILQNLPMFGDKKVFVNSIPAHMLNDDDWDRLMKKYGSLTERLVVEMTEQTEMDDEQLTKFRDRLKRNNISLAIDDYGTGFSNISNLIRYSPNYVKIDRALVQDIQDKPKIQKLVAGIIEFIHENGYMALAEGVETFEELKAMIGLGTDYVQGYYIAMPQAELLCEVDKKYRDEIVELYRIRSEYLVKVYCPGEGERVNLTEIAAQRYNAILIDKGNVVIEGVKGTTESCTISVKDGTKTNVTLKDVSITTEKDAPLIDIGLGSDVLFQMEGTNELINRGIRVPQGSDLRMTGRGNLYIRSEASNSYAIGGDSESTYGNIIIDDLPQMIIDINGDNCIGIGGGRNTSDSKITIIQTGIQLDCSGGNSICIGCFEGNSNIYVRNSGLEFKTACANSVGIGALQGSTRVQLDNYGLKMVESGNNLCGIGVLNNGEGSITTTNGTIELDIRGKNIVCVGTDSGTLDCNVEKSNILFSCEGNAIVGIGDRNGRGSVLIHDTTLNMNMKANNIWDIGCKSGRLELVGSTRNLKMNE